MFGILKKIITKRKREYKEFNDILYSMMPKRTINLTTDTISAEHLKAETVHISEEVGKDLLDHVCWYRRKEG